MTKKSLIIVIGCIVLFAGTAIPAHSESNYPVVQTGEGVGKILSSPVKVPEEVVKDSERRDPVTGTITGTVKGTGEGVEQIGEGTKDILEAPLKVFE